MAALRMAGVVGEQRLAHPLRLRGLAVLVVAPRLGEQACGAAAGRPGADPSS
jgi:hypothetical protein